jgi:hypothetical protein
VPILADMAKTGLLIRRFWVRVPGGYSTKALVGGAGQGLSRSCPGAPGPVITREVQYTEASEGVAGDVEGARAWRSINRASIPQPRRRCPAPPSDRHLVAGGVQRAQVAYRRRNQSTVRRTASGCRVGSNGPNARCARARHCSRGQATGHQFSDDRCARPARRSQDDVGRGSHSHRGENTHPRRPARRRPITGQDARWPPTGDCWTGTRRRRVDG